MLTPYTRSQFVQKILTSQTGEQFRVLFLVTLVNGEFKAQVVSATPLYSINGASLSGSHTETLCLPATRIKNAADTQYIPAHTPIVSPYTELYFFTSQPTRAPSYK